MGNLQDIVKKTANETLDIVIPKLAEEYDLELHKPDLSVTIYDYMPEAAGKFCPVGEYGLIKLQEESNRFKATCCGTAAHEMGHAAIYQNCPVYKETFDSNPRLLMVEEGISRKFMKKGLRFLKDEKYLSPYYFYSEMISFHLSNKIFGEVLCPSVYSVGEMIIDHYDKKGVSVKRLIVSPKEFEDDLKKNWMGMVKPRSRVALKLCDKLYYYLTKH
jgi:hypothetical protein